MSAAKTIVRQLLLELPAVQSQLGEQIYSDQVPTQATLPYAVLRLSSTDPGTLGRLHQVRVEVEINGSHDQVNDLAEQLNALHELRRQVGEHFVSGVFVADRGSETESPRNGTQPATFAVVTVLELWYRQPS